MPEKQRDILRADLPAVVEVTENQVEPLIQIIEAGLKESALDRETLVKFQNGYTRLTPEERPKFFSLLLERIEVTPESINRQLDAVTRAREDPLEWRRSLVDLRVGIESPRWRVFRRFINLPGGLKFLLDLRADLLSFQRRGHPDFNLLDHDLVSLLESWFQDGFLFLEEITLDSPYRQIELIKRGDMVHPMTNLEEVSKRLGRDRRCFALYHRAMPEEPVVFIEVALTKGVARSIQAILDSDTDQDEDRGRPDTAVFYSINNTQNGLAGLGLGKVLIFQVVDFLKKDAPDIRNFCTLSPMPGFWKRYLKPLLEDRSEGIEMDMEGVEKLFDKRSRALIEEEFAAQTGGARAEFRDVLLKVFSNHKWTQNRNLVQCLGRPLRRLGFDYLAEAKTRDGRPLDSVANFHLGNGAAISWDNVNFGANWTSRAVENSLSLMVNYVYSQDWRLQLQGSMTRLTGLLPWFSRLNRTG